ncbi:hypothetical protein, partial [Desulfovibrio sp.]|uniref:hypothetical protein n=1 Tax=Desulfovibrio sp. TaxID=885 RepID=UPI003076B0EA
MGRLFGLPPVTAPFPHPPFPHSKKGSVPGANIPGTLPFPSHQHQTGRYPLIVSPQPCQQARHILRRLLIKVFGRERGEHEGGEGEPFSGRLSNELHRKQD